MVTTYKHPRCIIFTSCTWEILLVCSIGGLCEFLRFMGRMVNVLWFQGGKWVLNIKQMIVYMACNLNTLKQMFVISFFFFLWKFSHLDNEQFWIQYKKIHLSHQLASTSFIMSHFSWCLCLNYLNLNWCLLLYNTTNNLLFYYNISLELCWQLEKWL
jgi:hypothetical protein